MKICFSLSFILFTLNCAFAEQAITYPVYNNNSNIFEISSIETPAHTFLAVVYDAGPGDQAIVMRSIDFGVTWDSIINFEIDSVYGSTYDPFLSVDSVGNIYLSAMRGTAVNWGAYNGHDTWIWKSADDGLTWKQWGYSPNAGSNTGTDFPRTVAWSDQEFLMSYQLLNSPNYSINIARSSDGGATWNSVDTISISNLMIGCASIGRGFGGKVHLSFAERTTTQVYYAESSDTGRTFSTSIVVANFSSLGYMYLTSIVSNPLIQHHGILFHAAHRFENSYYAYTSNGINWNTTFLDSTSGYCDAFIDSSGIIHLAYGKVSGTMYYECYRYSVDSGATFSTPFAVDSVPFSASLAFSMGDYSSILDGSDGKIHITWCANDGNRCSAKHSVLVNPFASVPVIEDNVEYLINYSSVTKSLTISNQLNGKFDVEIYDALSKTIFAKSSASNTCVVNMQMFKAGVYLVRVGYADKKGVVKKIYVN
ncbi:MAG: hypothetical protein IPP51_17715 [Bacteroidetes bacterium]|nr:hypothetical protein [Bacteroidota bacterium]